MFGNDNFFWNLGNKITSIRDSIQTSSIYTDAEEAKWGLKCWGKEKLHKNKGQWIWNEKEKNYTFVD